MRNIEKIILPLIVILGITGGIKGIRNKKEYNEMLSKPDSIGTYVVKKYDCLDRIGTEYKFRPSWMGSEDWRGKVTKMNDREHNPDSLVPGETIKIPIWYEKWNK